MGLFDFIGSIFAPATRLVDDLHTSEEEKMKLRNELAKIQGQALEKVTELEKARFEAMSKVQVAEAQSSNKLTSSWRPISSLAIVAIVILASFGLVPQPAQQFYDLAQIILGGYVIGRSTEKLAAGVAQGFKK